MFCYGTNCVMEVAEHCHILPQFSRKVGHFQPREYDDDYGHLESVEWDKVQPVKQGRRHIVRILKSYTWLAA